MSTLPNELRWPECIECGQPVTETQQAIGAYQWIRQTGLVHTRCLTAALVMLEAQMVTP